MITHTDINDAIGRLNTLAFQHLHEPSYVEAITASISELNDLLSNSIQEEINYKQYLEEQEADGYLSSMEAYEQAI